MKFEVQRDALATVVASAAKVAKEKGVMPQLADICLEVTQDSIEVRATDLEVHYQASVSASGAPGGCAVNAKRLAGFLKLAPNDVITAALSDKGRLNLKSGSSRASLAVRPVGDFPELPVIDDPEVVEVTALELAAALRAVKHAATKDTGRPAMLGVCFQSDAVVTTDGILLASVAGVEVPEKALGTWPTALVTAVLNIAVGGEAVVLAGDGWVGVEVLGQFVLGRLTEAKFPAWRKITRPPNTPGSWTATVDVKALQSALKRLAALGDETVVFEAPDSDTLRMRSASVLSSADERVPAACLGSFALVRVAIQGKRLSEVLRAHEGDDVTLEFGKKTESLIVRTEAGGVSMIMPTRLEDVEVDDE